MKIPMTPAGHDKLKNELRELKAERPRLADVILVARELGDLSENADYHAAKEKQGFLEGRIIEVESTLAQAEVIDPARIKSSRIAFGATVTLEDIDAGGEVKYSIVGDHESDVKAGLISINSPIARALLTREEGDEVKVRAPGGIRNYEVVEVTFVDLDI